MRRLSATLAIFFGLSGAAFAQSSPYLGQIMIFAGNFCPSGWSTTQGQTLPISQNTALFSLLGTTYGGNGTSTFQLPNTQPIFTQTRATFIQCIAMVGVFPPRN